jgi:type III secretory pathway component EscR
MIKKILILALFLVIPLFVSSPIISYAATTDSNTQQTEQKKITWEQFWKDIWAALGAFFANFKMEIKAWFAKEQPVDCLIQYNKLRHAER